MTPRQQLFNTFPTLMTERLILRKLDLTDVEQLYSLYNSVDIQKYQTHKQYSIQELVHYILNQEASFERQETIKWAIVRKSDGMFMGIRILYCDDDSGWVEIQGDTHKIYWKNGYTKEAYGAIINLLNSYKFKGIVANVQANNHNASFLLKSLNFKIDKHYVSNGIEFQEQRLHLTTNTFGF